MFDFGDFADYTTTEKVAVICSALLLLTLAVSAVTVFLLNRKKETSLYSTHDITYGAICLAIAFALGFIGVTFAQGGTITPASSLAIMLFCYFFGFRKSIVVCFAFMLLQFLQSPFIVHPMSAVLDYVIPYLSLIFFGIFSIRKDAATNTLFNSNPIKRDTSFFIAAACYVVVRYFSHVISGILFYGEYAWADWSVNAYSFAYNGFFLIDAAIALIAGFVLMSNKAFYRYMLQQTIVKTSDKSELKKAQ